MDHYSTLGIPRDASEGDVKRAYKSKALLHHPDKNGGDKRTETAFHSIIEAYEVLVDSKRRHLYDKYGEAGLKMNPAEAHAHQHDEPTNHPMPPRPHTPRPVPEKRGLKRPADEDTQSKCRVKLFEMPSCNVDRFGATDPFGGIFHIMRSVDNMCAHKAEPIPVPAPCKRVSSPPAPLPPAPAARVAISTQLPCNTIVTIHCASDRAVLELHGQVGKLLQHNPNIAKCVVLLLKGAGRMVVVDERQVRQASVGVGISSEDQPHTEGIAIGFEDSLGSYFVQVSNATDKSVLLLKPVNVIFKTRTVAQIVQHNKPDFCHKWVLVLQLLDDSQYLTCLGDGSKLLISPSNLRL